jgi:hypothetical protein
MVERCRVLQTPVQHDAVESILCVPTRGEDLVGAMGEWTLQEAQPHEVRLADPLRRVAPTAGATALGVQIVERQERRRNREGVPDDVHDADVSVPRSQPSAEVRCCDALHDPVLHESRSIEVVESLLMDASSEDRGPGTRQIVTLRPGLDVLTPHERGRCQG